MKTFLISNCRLLGFVLLLGLWVAPALAYDETITHPSLVKQAADYYNANATQKLSEEQISLMMQGAQGEDDPAWRSLNHFYDPINDNGLEVAPGQPVGYSSMQWSMGQQDAQIYWRNDAYAQAVAAGRRKDLSTAFRQLGASLHLIADAGVPAHVRNDEHLEGDPYESWVKWQAQYNAAALRLYDPDISRPRCGDFQTCLRQLALYTNHGYFSGDTISRDVYYEPYDSIVITKDGYAQAGGHLVAHYNPLLKRLELNEVVLLDNWHTLAPRVIGYEARAIELFMDEAGLKPPVKGKGQIASGVKIYSKDAEAAWPIPVIDESQGVPIQFLLPPSIQPVLPAGGTPAPAPTVATSSSLALPVESVPAATGATATPAVDVIPPPAASSSSPVETASSSPTSSEPVIVVPAPATQKYLWLFDETAGAEALEATGGPTIHNYGDWGEGKSGSCLKTNSIDGKFAYAVRDYFLPAGEMTMAFDIKDGSDPGYRQESARVVIMGGDFSEIAGIAPNVIQVAYYYQGQRKAFTSALPDDHAWHRVVAVYSVVGLKLYMDGNLLEVMPGDFSLPAGAGSIYIVGENATTYIDNLAIWSQALSPN
ncbi:MAG: LamG-like jellyroll fold domain-containing protein [Candidatus Falkowbacteria bacterium]